GTATTRLQAISPSSALTSLTDFEVEQQQMQGCEAMQHARACPAREPQAAAAAGTTWQTP
ncbi:hypothetical protein HaLaN_26710, partial [Haematococcus lacustris]